MEEQNLLLDAPKKNKYWKFVIGFLGIIILFGGGYFIWDNYLSPKAVSNRETEQNYQKFLDWQKNYENAMKNDIYGGKTPEETLKMFIDALKKGDVELASKYFMFNENGGIDDEIINNLNILKNKQAFSEIINLILSVKFDEKSSSVDTKWFVVKNKDGIVENSIILKLNKYSGIWKIESM